MTVSLGNALSSTRVKEAAAGHGVKVSASLRIVNLLGGNITSTRVVVQEVAFCSLLAGR